MHVGRSTVLQLKTDGKASVAAPLPLFNPDVAPGFPQGYRAFVPRLGHEIVKSFQSFWRFSWLGGSVVPVYAGLPSFLGAPLELRDLYRVSHAALERRRRLWSATSSRT